MRSHRSPRSHLSPTAGVTVDRDEEIGSELLRSFFPLPPGVINGGQAPRALVGQLPMEPLSMAEVREAVFGLNPHKAPGTDGMPAAVWQQLWRVTHNRIFSLFSRSIDEGKLPRDWKVAKIIPLRKPDKPDYTKQSQTVQRLIIHHDSSSLYPTDLKIFRQKHINGLNF